MSSGAASASENDLLRAIPDQEKGDPIAERQAAASTTLGNVARKIVATIHERLAFSISVLVLVVLGAGLGIIFRGAHILTAFGISFVPSILVIVSIVMGRQLAVNAGTHGTGLLVLWAGIALVALLDVWMLARALRR